MEKLLKKFNIAAKRSSDEELRLWRNFVMPVKNSRRRFRYVANLDKRLEAKEMMAKIRNKQLAMHLLYMEALKDIQAGDEFGPDMPFGRDGQAEETTFKAESQTAGSAVNPFQVAVLMI